MRPSGTTVDALPEGQARIRVNFVRGPTYTPNLQECNLFRSVLREELERNSVTMFPYFVDLDACQLYQASLQQRQMLHAPHCLFDCPCTIGCWLQQSALHICPGIPTLIGGSPMQWEALNPIDAILHGKLCKERN